MKKLLLILALLLPAAYGGLWYYSCLWLENEVQRAKFNFSSLGVNFSGEFNVSEIEYAGFWQGQAGINFRSKDSFVKYSIKMPDDKVVETTAKTSSGEAGVGVEIRAPLFGSSICFRQPDKVSLDYILQHSGQPEQKFKFEGQGLGSKIDYSDTKFIFMRDSFYDGIKTWQDVLMRIKGFEVYPYESSMTKFGQTEPVLVGRGKGMRAAWSVSDQGMFEVNGHLDAEADYGKEFLSSMVPPPGADPESFKLGKMIFEELFGGSIEGYMRGKFAFSFPAKLIGLQGEAQARAGFQNVPPFSVRLTDFDVRMPLFLEGDRRINLNVAFLQNDGKPIKVELHQLRKGFDAMPTLEKIIERVRVELKSDPRFAVDFAKRTLSDIGSLAELSKEQGGYLGVIAGAQVFNALASSDGKLDLLVDIKTESGNFSPFEMFGATTMLEFYTTLGPKTKVKINGSLTGASTMTLNGEFHELDHLVRMAAPVIKTLVAIKTSVILTQDTSIPPEVDSKLLDLIRSEKLIDKAVESLNKILALVDGDPSGAKIIEAKFEMGTAGPKLNGKAIDSVVGEISPALMQEAVALQSFVSAELEGIQPGLSKLLEQLGK